MKCHVVKKLDDVERIVNGLRRKNGPYAIDLETSSTDPFRGYIVGIGLSWSEDGGVYIPIRHRYDQPFDGSIASATLRPLLMDYQFNAFNALFELEFLEHDWKLIPNTRPIDTSLLTYALGRWDYQKLSIVCKQLCPHIGVKDYADFMLSVNLSPKKNQIDEAPIDEVGEYCVRDTTACMIIYNKLYEKVQEHPIYKLEEKVFPVVQRIRRKGVLVDREFVADEERQLKEHLENLQMIIEHQVSEKTGEPVSFNIASGKQLAEVLYDVLGLPCDRMTAKGARRTDKDTLANLKWKHPIVRNIITHKEITKRVTTYYNNYMDYVQTDGRIHASYNQTGVVTGRFSCSDPNLQNPPRKNEWEVERKQGNFDIKSNFRRCFIVPKDYWFVEADYSQIEARIAAGVTQDPVLIRVFSEGLDHHTNTAFEVYGVPLNKVTKDQRYMGKRLNFALGYGMGENLLYFVLRQDMDISYDQTVILRKRYMKAYATMFHEAEKISIQARRDKYVTTIFGRRVPINLYLEAAALMGNTQEIQKRRHKLISDGDRMAYNAVIQGSAADLLKIAMVKCQKKIDDKYPGVDMMLTTHDSLAFEVPKSVNLVEFLQDIKDTMHLKMDKFPEFFAEYMVGSSWGSLKEPEKGQSIEEFVQQLEMSTDIVHGEKREHTYVLEIPSGEGRTSEQLSTLKQMLDTNKGDNTVILKIGEVEKVITKGTSIGVEEREKVLLIFGGKFYERL